MANEYFNASGYPGTRASGSSSAMRSQLAAIAAGFDKLPALSSNAGKLLLVNSGGTGVTSTSVISVSGSTTTLTGALAMAGALSGVTTLNASGAVTLGSTLGVTGAASFTGAATFSSTIRQNGATQGTVGIRVGSGSGATVNASADELVIDANGNAGLSILTVSGSTAFLLMGDSAGGTNVAGMTYAPATGILGLRAGSATPIATLSQSAIALNATTTISALGVTGAATFSGTSVFNGSTAINGGLVVGDAAGDSLIINSSTVSWANGATHTGNHVFSGTVAFNGNVSIGDIGSDTISFANSAVTWSGNPTHSGSHTFSGAVALGSTLRQNGATQGTVGVRVGTGSGATVNAAADDLVIDGDGNCGMSILTVSGSTALLLMGDSAGPNFGGVTYAPASGTLGLRAGSATPVMTLTQTSVSITPNVSVGGTFTATGEITIPNLTPTSALSAGFRGVPSIGNTATATKAAVGKVYKNTGNLAINNSVFAADDVFAVYNNSASAITLNGTITTMRLAGTTTTGNRTLAPRGWASVFFVSATECIVSGAGVS